MSRKYGASHDFDKVPSANIDRSSFNRSHGSKFTCDAGLIVPIFVDEVLPGDTFNCRLIAFGRLSTPIFPIMDNVHISTHFFFVPNRLIWNNWERFNGEQDNPGDSTDYNIPLIAVKPEVNSVADYFGLPLGKTMNVSALPFRSHNLIFNDWFRDENLQPSLAVPVNDGPDSQSDYNIERSRKRKDYFTGCLPWPQKGTASFIADTGNLAVTTTSVPNYPFGHAFHFETDTGRQGVFGSKANDWNVKFDREALVHETLYHAPDADGLDIKSTSVLTGSVHTTVNALREAIAVQRMLERDARGGTRYIEIIKSQFGVVSPDSRLQRPEYLGGGHSRLDVSQVAQTSNTNSTSPQGNLSGFGTAELHGHGFKKSFTEHGHVLGYMVVRADLTYSQGINRMWSRKTRFDFYWPAFAHLGEQAVLNKEIYYNGDSDDDKVFGYQERHAEYRYKPSSIHGKLRSSSSGSLDAWHLSQFFSSRPSLSLGFVQDQPPFDRVVAVPSEPTFIFDCYFKLICARPLPTYGVPGGMSNF
jgi:hypothetical protein